MVKKKVTFVFLVLCLLFSAVLFKAFIIQIYDRKALIAKSKKQIFRETKVFTHRGNIFDREGSPLAINVQTYSIFTIPKTVIGGVESYRKLSEIIPKLTFDRIKNKIKNRKNYTWLARKITLSDEQVENVKKLGKRIGGIYIESVPRRFYPNHELLSQTLGFVGVDNVGLAGVEYQFDELLKGKPTVRRYFKDAKGRPVKIESKVVGEPKDIFLTIDKDLQSIAEKALKEAVIEYNALKGGVGIIDVGTGEVLAIANYPSFDSNLPLKSKAEHRKLSFVTDPFEPGSIFKIFTVASALEHNIARPDTSYYCERGKFEIGNHIINEAESAKKYEWLSVNEIIAHSSNIGTTKIAFDLTFPKLKKTLLDLNIGHKTGIEIPGESRGIFYKKKNISPLHLSNISFGQGVATTGIQILAAYAAIVNDGVYIPPTIIKDQFNFREKKRVLSKQTAKELQQMLVQAVENGTGGNAKIPHFSIGGKTSTAQRPIPGEGYEGYIPGFIGFPLNIQNKFVVYVYVDYPKGKKYYGGVIAAPVFKKISQHLLYKNRDISTFAIKTKPSKNSMDKIKLKQMSTRVVNKNKIPNFVGLDKMSARKIIKQLKLKSRDRGIGVVVSQIPKAGTLISKNSVVKLLFSPPHYEQ